MKNKIKIGLIVLLILVSGTTLLADSRFDVGAAVPVYAGMIAPGYGMMGMPIPFIVPVPDLGLYYLMEMESVNIGLGARAFSALVYTVAFPSIFVETKSDSFIWSAQLAGGAACGLGVLGLPPFVDVAPVFALDVSGAFKVNSFFRWGFGGACVIAFGENEEDYYDNYDSYSYSPLQEMAYSFSEMSPFAVYAFGKFTLDF